MKTQDKIDKESKTQGNYNIRNQENCPDNHLTSSHAYYVNFDYMNYKSTNLISRWNAASCVEVLLAWGADVNAETQGRQTPLHLAAFCGNSRDTLQLLLMHPDLRPLSFNCQHDTPRDIALRQAFIFVHFSPHVGFHSPSFT